MLKLLLLLGPMKECVILCDESIVAFHDPPEFVPF